MHHVLVQAFLFLWASVRVIADNLLNLVDLALARLLEVAAIVERHRVVAGIMALRGDRPFQVCGRL